MLSIHSYIYNYLSISNSQSINKNCSIYLWEHLPSDHALSVIPIVFEVFDTKRNDAQISSIAHVVQEMRAQLCLSLAAGEDSLPCCSEAVTQMSPIGSVTVQF